MRLLCIDIETRPSLAYVWRLWDENVGLDQLIETTEMLCFAAKWIGEKGVEFRSTYHDGQSRMIGRAWDLLHEADAVIHYNGKSFDVPHLNREFLQAGLTPPSPYKQIDLLSTVKKKFRFTSNKLAHVSVQLGLAGKVQHSGFNLWVRCMADDKAAWVEMKEYNIQDTVLLEDMYLRLRPWISAHPNVALFDPEVSDQPKCPKCGGTELIKEGFRYTSIARFQQYSCKKCGSWSSVGKRESGVDLRESV